MLKLTKRPKSSNWIMRGTVRGVSIEESTGVADRKTAEEILAKRQADPKAFERRQYVLWLV